MSSYLLGDKLKLDKFDVQQRSPGLLAAIHAYTTVILEKRGGTGEGRKSQNQWYRAPQVFNELIR